MRELEKVIAAMTDTELINMVEDYQMVIGFAPTGRWVIFASNKAGSDSLPERYYGGTWREAVRNWVRSWE